MVKEPLIYVILRKIVNVFRKGTVMSGYHYQISEASRLLAVEAHVLRYWEEELGMIIPRNEMGHRYYTEEHLRIFSQIKDMKERGYQLRAIRAILSGEEPPEPLITEIPLKKNQKNLNGEPHEKEIYENKGYGEAPHGEQLDSPGQASVDMPGQGNNSAPVKIPRTRTMPPEFPSPDASPQPEVQPRQPEPEIQPGKQYGERMDVGQQYRPEAEVELQSGIQLQTSDTSMDQAQTADNRMNQFQAVMTHIVAQAMLCNNPGLAKDISRQMEVDLLPEIRKMMNSSESRQEERFRKLDESMRAIQQGNRARYEAAAAKSPGLFGRKRRRRKYRKF